MLSDQDWSPPEAGADCPSRKKRIHHSNLHVNVQAHRMDHHPESLTRTTQALREGALSWPRAEPPPRNTQWTLLLNGAGWETEAELEDRSPYKSGGTFLLMAALEVSLKLQGHVIFKGSLWLRVLFLEAWKKLAPMARILGFSRTGPPRGPWKPS